MPEGHTIHRLARRHTELLVGSALSASSPQGRFADGAARIDGRVLTKVDPYGKHLFYAFEGIPDRLHVHLGLYGTFIDGMPPAPEPRGALRLRLWAPGAYADLRGPTACELLTPAEVASIYARLGPDPLRPRSDPEPAWRRIAGSKVPVGALLMDQSVVAGIGNVYRAEILFRAGISPFRPGRCVVHEQWDGMWADLRERMRAGVREGHIVTTRPSDRPFGTRRGVPPREARFYVYRRTGDPCRVCGTEVQTAVMAARNVYWCPHCQPD
jgi:endonuclease VIII